ncbi:AraC family transcriptional regulator [Akkermansiaceae bacterium]|jgi:AraC-like DNA-binding protein|nr:AraC family transcriptional regulator [Akkermansiaceae bacterium]
MCPTPTPSEESSKFEGFIGRLRSGQIALGLFEALPEVMFWLKDETGIIIFANRACSDVLRSKPENLVGKTDHDLYPRAMADVYQSDDKKVFRTGKAMHNKLELLTRPGGAIEWRMASKIPLFDLNDTVIGTAGISRRLEHGEGPPLPTPHRAISELIDHVNEHLEEPITVQDLAQRASMSVSSLERRFRQYLGTTPKRYLVHARIAAACDLLLNTTLSIGQIASSLTYQEHASFTRAFASVMHMSPKDYRQFYR